MATTLLQMRTRVRYMLNETTASFWTDAMLNQWINDACDDLARDTETLLKVTSPALVSAANTQDIAAPTDLLRIHRIVHKYNSETQQNALHPMDLSAMDSVWGSRSDMQGRPCYFALWGTNPSVTIKLFPVPTAAGTLTVYYYRRPVAASADGDSVDVAGGWEELVENYCEYRAKRRDQDPSWQEAKALYDEKKSSMISHTRRLTDQAGVVVNDFGSMIPSWLYAGEVW